MKKDYIRRDSVLSIVKSPRSQQQMINMIEGLPGVYPTKTTTGRWVGIDDEPHENFECNRCGNIMCAVYDIDDYKYCPECGARMVGVSRNDYRI